MSKVTLPQQYPTQREGRGAICESTVTGTGGGGGVEEVDRVKGVVVSAPQLSASLAENTIMTQRMRESGHLQLCVLSLVCDSTTSPLSPALLADTHPEPDIENLGTLP